MSFHTAFPLTKHHPSPNYRPLFSRGTDSLPSTAPVPQTLQDGSSAILSLSCFYSDLRSLDAAHSTHTFEEPARSMGWCRARLCFLPQMLQYFQKQGQASPSLSWFPVKIQPLYHSRVINKIWLQMLQFKCSLFYLMEKKDPILKRKKKWADTTDCDRFITIYHGKYVWKKTYRCLYLGTLTPKETIFFCYKNVHTYWSKF